MLMTSTTTVPRAMKVYLLTSNPIIIVFESVCHLISTYLLCKRSLNFIGPGGDDGDDGGDAGSAWDQTRFDMTELDATQFPVPSLLFLSVTSLSPSLSPSISRGLTLIAVICRLNWQAQGGELAGSNLLQAPQKVEKVCGARNRDIK